MHLNLACSVKATRSRPPAVLTPRATDIRNYRVDWDTTSSPTMSDAPPHSEGHSPSKALPELSSLWAEVNLQQALSSYASSTTEMLSTSRGNDPFPQSDKSGAPTRASPDMWLLDSNRQFQSLTEDISHTVNQAKYYMYEVSSYWPAIYRIILNGGADSELLPYGPLFFESVSSFLCAARIGLSLCRPKAWFLCARFVLTIVVPHTCKRRLHSVLSIYVVSIATVRVLEVPTLGLLAPPPLWEQLEASVDAMQGPSELSPSVRYMRESLKDRLDMVRV
jgi:hypothetical protein